MGLRDQPTDPKAAWSSLLTNMLVVPGLGSVLMGRWWGLIQMASAVAGVSLTGYGVFALLRPFLEAETSNVSSLNWQPLALGIAVFLGGWIWAVIDGWILWRRAVRQSSASRPVPPVIGEDS